MYEKQMATCNYAIRKARAIARLDGTPQEKRARFEWLNYLERLRRRYGSTNRNYLLNRSH